MDTSTLTDKVADRLGGQIHLIDGKLPIVAIVMATVEELAEAGFLTLERPDDDDVFGDVEHGQY